MRFGSVLPLRVGVTFFCIQVVTASSAYAQAGKGSGGGTTNIIPIGGECGIGPTQPAPIKPEKHDLSAGGVDMRSGEFKYSKTDLSISDESAGLSLVRSMQWDQDAALPFGEFFTHNWDIRLVEDRIQVCEANVPDEFDYLEQVVADGIGSSFRSKYTATSFRQISNGAHGGLILTGSKASGGVFTFTAEDGTKVVFNPLRSPASAQACVANYPKRCTFADKLIKTDGTVYDLNYDASGTKLVSVTSSRGFAIRFEYTGAFISKACIINLALDSQAQTAGCTSGVPTVGYGYSGSFLTSFTDVAGKVFSQSSSSQTSPRSISFYKPGIAVPEVTNTLNFLSSLAGPKWYVVHQAFGSGETYSYSWTQMPNGDRAGGLVTDRSGASVSLVYGEHGSQLTGDPTTYITPGPERIVDALGYVTTGDYCVYIDGTCRTSIHRSWTDPEGSRRRFTYNTTRQPTEIVYEPKPGSNGVIYSETFAYNCGSVACSHKPTSVTGRSGATTTYQYNTVHGGVVRETSPADANGVSPVKRSYYLQKQAWIKAASASGYVVAGDPIWLLASERTCQKTATVGDGCAGGTADEVVTAYQYQDGNASTPSNLWLIGRSVTAGGQTLRTCYAYDRNGNRISETAPRANLGVCP